ncbi:IS3 family transposase [Paenibacillus sp. LPE1-1-1.1]|uniref:IS3 family transposase n=1 Tax=Paenibacillus sp. LPE1-1-1.1 TaxID=3135230 RepID=UPI003426B6AD
MESFWETLKCEKYYLHTYHTFEELERDIEAYIHFYNNERSNENKRPQSDAIQD